MMQIGRNLTDPIEGFMVEKEFLIIDRDSKYSSTFQNLLKDDGIRVVLLPPRSSNLNGYVERVIGSIRRACTDHVIALSE